MCEDSDMTQNLKKAMSECWTWWMLWFRMKFSRHTLVEITSTSFCQDAFTRSRLLSGQTDDRRTWWILDCLCERATKTIKLIDASMSHAVPFTSWRHDIMDHIAVHVCHVVMMRGVNFLWLRKTYRTCMTSAAGMCFRLSDCPVFISSYITRKSVGYINVCGVLILKYPICSLSIFINFMAVIFATASRLALRPTQLLTQWVPVAVSSGVQRPGSEADHSPPSSAVVLNLRETAAR